MYKAKWQQLLSEHSSSQSASQRLQRDLQQLQGSYADLQEANRALESRLLGYHSTVAASSPYEGSPGRAPSHQQQPHQAYGSVNSEGHISRVAGNSPVQQPYPEHLPSGRTGTEPSRPAPKSYPKHLPPGRPGDEMRAGWNGSGDLDRVLADHQKQVYGACGQAIDQSERYLRADQTGLQSHSMRAQTVGSDAIMDRLTGSAAGAASSTGTAFKLVNSSKQ